MLDKGDIEDIAGIMKHRLRDPEFAGNVQMLTAWTDRILEHAPDNLPLPPE